MPQMHLYLSDELAVKVRENATRQGVSASKYMARIVKKELSNEWPAGYFDSFGIDDPSFRPISDDDLLPLKDVEL